MLNVCCKSLEYLLEFIGKCFYIILLANIDRDSIPNSGSYIFYGF